MLLMLIYAIFSWMAVTKIQNSSGIVFFASLSDYFLKKLMICLFLGWLAIPISLLMLLFSKKTA